MIRRAENKDIADDERPIYVSVDDDEEVLGYVFCVYEYTKDTTCTHEHKSMYIDDLCVDEKRRGEHIGKELYEYACQVAKENYCYRVTLHVWECNPGAYEFYKKIGMKSLNTTMEYIL